MWAYRTIVVGLGAALVLGCGRDPVASAPASGGPAASPSSASCPLPAKRVAGREDDTSLDGTKLEPCSGEPLTGYFRDGTCSTGEEDTGRHVVCAEMTAAFLAYTRSRGNDLVTPRGAFPGLSPGQRWCVCASRWREAHEAGVAPPVVVSATHARAAELVPGAALRGAAAPTKAGVRP